MHSTYVDFIRHGEPEGGLVFRGRTDHALTALGQQQFEARLAAAANAQWDVIVSSPLKRCLHSAQLLAEHQQLPLVIEPDFAEIDFGLWENRLVAEVMEEHNLSEMWQHPMSFCAPQGESTQQLQQRCIQGWQRLVAAHRGKRILVVAHGGVMRVLAHYLLELNEASINKLSLPFAALMRFKLVESDHQGEAQQWINLISLDGHELTL